MLHGLGMREHSAERDSSLDSKRFRELLKAVPLRAIANNCKVGHATSQKGSGGGQSEITSLKGHQRTEENQFEFSIELWSSHGSGTKGRAQAILREKEKLLAIARKFRVGL